MAIAIPDIPEIFLSSETGAPFDECLVCSKDLSQARFLVEKAFVNYPDLETSDLVWEYAMCMDCAEEQKKEYSEESNRRLNEYFIKRMNLGRQLSLLKNENFETDDWISECLITGKPIGECKQYQVYGYFMGKYTVYEQAPFMLSDDALDKAVELISDQTLGFMNDFRDKHFPPPEDLSPLFPERDFVMI